MNTNDNKTLDPLELLKQRDELIEKLKQENDMLNSKTGNLFYIYQTVSKMFDQLSTEQFAQLAVEAFSELTDSELTALFLKNDESEAYELVMHRSLKRDKSIKQLFLYPMSNIKLYMPGYVDLTEESQREIILNQFYNGEELMKKIKPIHIIAIKTNNELKGFITVSKRMGGNSYDKETMEIIQSLGRALSLVFNTERSFYKIKQQKDYFDQKLRRLMDLGSLAKTVNSVTSIDTVVSLIMSSLSVDYHANLAFFALYDADSMVFEIQSTMGMEDSVNRLPLKGGLLPLLVGEKIIMVEAEKVKTLFEDVFLEGFKVEPTGALIMPIFIEEFEIKLIGAIGLLSTEGSILTSEENVMAIEFMANHIAPIIYHIQRVDEIKALYHPDYYQQFIEALKNNIYGVDVFDLDLYVIWVSNNKKLQFLNNDLVGRLFGKFEDVYCVDNQNTLLMTTDFEDLAFIRNFLSEDESIKTYQYKKDFNTVEDFIRLF